MDALDAVIKSRELLRVLTPLKPDCGKICGAACCRCDEDGQGGMLLFPEEERLYSPLPPGFSLSRDDAVMPDMRLLTCSGECDRELRPLACRMFPLTPLLAMREGQEKLSVRMDPRAFAVCPLSEHGLRGLDGDFAQAVLQCGRYLNQCEEHKRYLRALAAYFERLKVL